METYETREIKEILKGYFKFMHNVELKEEKLCVGKQRGRVDLGGYFNDKEIGVEIKITKNDLIYSPYGHNFGLQISILAVPYHLKEYAINFLSLNKLNHVCLIVVGKDKSIQMITPYKILDIPTQVFKDNYTNKISIKIDREEYANLIGVY